MSFQDEPDNGLKRSSIRRLPQMFAGSDGFEHQRTDLVQDDGKTY